MGFGKSHYGNTQSNKCPTYSIEMGDNVYRFYPPMHSLAELNNPRHFQYAATHWGFAGTDSQNPGKTRMKPFKCIEVMNWSTKTPDVVCPQCEVIAEYKKQTEDMKAELRTKFLAEGKSEEEIEALLKDSLKLRNDWLRTFNVDRKFYYAAKRQENGKNCHVKLSSMTKKKLEAKFEELAKVDGIDPTALDQGVWINIRRNDKNGQNDEIVVVTEKVEATVNGKTKLVNEIVAAPISDEEAAQALEEIRDLAEVGGFVLTADQIEALTKCSGDPEEIDKIFGVNNQQRSTAAPASTGNAAKPAAAKPASGAKTGTLDPNDPAVKARLAQIQAKKEAEAKAAKAAKAAEEAAKAAKAKQVAAAEEADESESSDEGKPNPYQMDDDEFLRQFEQQA